MERRSIQILEPWSAFVLYSLTTLNGEEYDTTGVPQGEWPENLIREFWVKGLNFDVKVNEVPLEIEDTPEDDGLPLEDAPPACSFPSGSEFSSDGGSLSGQFVPRPSSGGSWRVWVTMTYSGTVGNVEATNSAYSTYNSDLDFTSTGETSRIDKYNIHISGQMILRRPFFSYPENGAVMSDRVAPVFYASMVGPSEVVRVNDLQANSYSHLGVYFRVQLVTLSTCYLGARWDGGASYAPGNSSPSSASARTWYYGTDSADVDAWVAAVKSSQVSYSIGFVYRNMSTGEQFTVPDPEAALTPPIMVPNMVPNPYEVFVSASNPTVFALVKSGKGELIEGNTEEEAPSIQKFAELVYKSIAKDGEITDLGSTASDSDWRKDAVDLVPTASIEIDDSTPCLRDFLATTNATLNDGNLYTLDLNQNIVAAGETQPLKTVLESDPGESGPEQLTVNITIVHARPDNDNSSVCKIGTSTPLPCRIPVPGRGTVLGVAVMPN